MFDPALAVQNVMTEKEKISFLANFIKINPHWRGAHVADVLDELANRDAHLAIIEPLAAEHGCEVGKPGLFTAATLAIVYIDNLAYAEWPRVKELVDRVATNEKGDHK